MSAMHDEGMDAMSDGALMERLFELTLGDADDSTEAARIEAAVYRRLHRTYSDAAAESEPA
ncbi:MAG: hypothetical protein KY442_04485 [Proteobacteria bacterium]|nr:hypothetical protein [Pseudomonadota bacterium]